MVDFKREALVSTAWLADNLAAPDLRVVDASYYLPNEGLDGRREFEAHHIPGAVFFDIDAIKDPASALPHMLPPPHIRSEEHTSELKSLMRTSSAVFCLNKKKKNNQTQ